MNKNIVLLSTLFAAGAASAQAGTQLGARAYHSTRPGLEEAGCGSKTEAKGEKQNSCGSSGCGSKPKEGTAPAKEGKAKAGAEKGCGGGKDKAKTAKGSSEKGCGADKAKDPKAPVKDPKAPAKETAKGPANS